MQMVPSIQEPDTTALRSEATLLPAAEIDFDRLPYYLNTNHIMSGDLRLHTVKYIEGELSTDGLLSRPQLMWTEDALISTSNTILTFLQIELFSEHTITMRGDGLQLFRLRTH